MSIATFAKRRPVATFFLVFLLIIGILIAWFAFRVVRAAVAQPSVNTDYVALINEVAAAVPPSERAWPDYLAAVAANQPPQGEALAEALTDARPGDEMWPEVAAYLRANQDSIDLIRIAAEKPSLGMLIGAESANELAAAQGHEPIADPLAGGTEPDLVIGILLPNLGATRNLARLIAKDTLVAAEDGDSARVVENLRTNLVLAEQTAQPPVLISQLVQVAIESLTANTVRQVLTYYPDALDEASLRAIEALLAPRVADPDRMADFSIEKMMFYDIVQRSFTDDGTGDGYMTSRGFREVISISGGQTPGGLGAFAAAIASSRAETVAMYDDAMAIIEDTSKDRIERADDFSTYFDTLMGNRSFPPDLGLVMVGSITPSLSNVARSYARNEALINAARIVVALERYRLENEAWPESLGTLIPDYLERVPLDAPSSNPFSYRVTDGEALLYSLGADGDDDGGRHNENALRGGSDADGDVVLFPVPERED